MAEKPQIYFYHDGRHPLIYMYGPPVLCVASSARPVPTPLSNTLLCFRYEPPITQEQYEHAVDELLGTPVQVLNFCLGDGRTMLHDTQVGELWGANVEDGSHPAIGDDGWSHAIFRRAHQNAKALIDDGLDPLSVVVERAHARGMKLYPVLLVQQGSDDGVRCSTFHLEHAAEYAIEHQGPLPDDFPENGRGCFDWTLPGVREVRLAIVRETIEGYPIDGFELQMNCISPTFSPFSPVLARARPFV